MSSTKSATVWCRQHVFCIITMLLLVLISVTVLLCGDDKDVVSHLNFACAIIGILFALLVIIYTLIDGAGIRGNLNEMRKLMAELRGDVGKTTSAVYKLQDKFNMDLLRSSDVSEEKEDVEQSDEAKNFSFQISAISNYTLLMIYCAIQSYRQKKSYVLLDVLKKIHPGAATKTLLQFCFAYFGIINMLQGVIRRSIDVEIRKQVKTEYIPTEVCDLVENRCKKLEEEYSKGTEEREMKDDFIIMKHAIDDYFTALG